MAALQLALTPKRRTPVSFGPWLSRRAVALAIGCLAGTGLALAGASKACEPAEPPPPLAGRPEARSVVDPAPPAEADPDAPAAFAGRRPTPMKPRRAAEILSWAWEEVTGTTAGAETVAVLWAHWAHETGRGRAMVDHNFGGLKGRGPSGASSRVWTHERREGEKTRVRARFRAYLTAEQGACDYVQLLRERFKAAFVAAEEGDVEAFVRALAGAGYFTEDPASYGRALQSLFQEYRAEYGASNADGSEPELPADSRRSS